MSLNKSYAVTLLSTTSDRLKQIADREGVKYKGIEIKRDIAIGSDLISLLRLIAYFIRSKPHVIHCNTPKASFLALIAGYLVGIPVSIYFIHGLRYEGAFGLKQRMLKLMEKISCFCATDIIAVSFGTKSVVEKELTNKKVDIIHYGSANGLSISEFLNSSYDESAVKKKWGIDEKDFVFGFVGRMVGDKGINELIEAFTEINEVYPNTKLLLVGTYEEQLDPVKPITKKRIKENPAIIETGFLNDVKETIFVMDVFISPSYREGFGMTLLEANLMGKPVIATEITGYSEIVKEGINGFLIPSKNVLVLKEKMEYALFNQEKLKSMSTDCVNEISSRYNHEEVLKHALDYYSKWV